MRKLFSLLFLWLTVVSAQANLLENGDLEQWDSGQSFPQGWGTSTLLTNASIVKLSSGVFSGTNALQAQYTFTSSHSRFNSPYFTVTPGTRYKLTFFTKGTAVLRWIVMSPTGLTPRAPVDGEPHLPASDYNIAGIKLQNATSLTDVDHVRKLQGYSNYYRVRSGDYRLGIKVAENHIEVIRFLHRKDIYRRFP